MYVGCPPLKSIVIRNCTAQADGGPVLLLSEVYDKLTAVCVNRPILHALSLSIAKATSYPRPAEFHDDEIHVALWL